MELTKKDKRHIEEEVRKLQFRIAAESREYAITGKKCMRVYEEGVMFPIMDNLFKD